ncbi:MarR family winged helix-turn-helix transcriptional regulator [Luteococcus peritonei]|uniref:MarR family winged helix-turn-helix transcriptional regulator n=1 Tax=Luteococcus peritonei TaxID=88874 RepID=A0ABW4RWA1_9ACTN
MNNSGEVVRLADAMIRAGALVRVVRRRERSVVPGLEPGQLGLFDALAAGPCRITELAAALQLELSTVSRRISRLVELGLVEKLADATDRRVQMAALTGQGREALDRIQQERRTLFAEMLEGWQGDDVSQLARLLEQLADQIERCEHLRRD